MSCLDRETNSFSHEHTNTHSHNSTKETFENNKREKQREGARRGSGARLPGLNIHFLSRKRLEWNGQGLISRCCTLTLARFMNFSAGV